MSDASEHDPPPPPPLRPPSAHVEPFQRGQEDKMNRENVRLLVSGGGTVVWGPLHPPTPSPQTGVGERGGIRPA